MNILNGIINKNKELRDYMLNIDIKELEKFSRQELEDFNSSMRDIKERYITSEVGKIIENKKFEEFPVLLGVYHYPELKEIDYITEEQLIKLDNDLAQNRGANTSFSINFDIKLDLREKIYDFLLEKEILIKKTYLSCNCGSGWLSRSFDSNLIEQWVLDLISSNKSYENTGLLIEHATEFFGYCSNCDEDFNLGDLDKDFFNNLRFKSYFVKIKERDKQWDNV